MIHPHAAAHALRALVIDDDSLTLSLVGDLLHDCGVQAITTATDGSLGIAAFDQARPRPDLVVVDLQMPEHDGFQIMQWLAARNYRGGLILISGQEPRVLREAGELARFHQLQMLGALPKPLDPEALARAVARLQ
jgi:two-component system, chemotaxis family, chemotaxis protein CheY